MRQALRVFSGLFDNLLGLALGIWALLILADAVGPLSPKWHSFVVLLTVSYVIEVLGRLRVARVGDGDE